MSDAEEVVDDHPAVLVQPVDHVLGDVLQGEKLEGDRGKIALRRRVIA